MCGWSADDWIGSSRSWTLDVLAPEIKAFCGMLDPVVARLVSIARLKAGDRLISVVRIFHRDLPLPVDRSSMSAHQPTSHPSRLQYRVFLASTPRRCLFDPVTLTRLMLDQGRPPSSITKRSHTPTASQDLETWNETTQGELRQLHHHDTSQNQLSSHNFHNFPAGALSTSLVFPGFPSVTRGSRISAVLLYVSWNPPKAGKWGKY